MAWKGDWMVKSEGLFGIWGDSEEALFLFPLISTTACTTTITVVGLEIQCLFHLSFVVSFFFGPL